MNILFCNFEYPPLGGGGGVLNAWLAEHLAKSHRVTVLTSGGAGLASDEEINGVRIVRVPVRFQRNQQAANVRSMAAYVINALRVGRDLVRRESFDIINTHFVLPTGPVGQRLAGLAGIPNVLSVHGGDLYDPSKRLSPHRHAAFRWMIRRLLHSADAVVGQSRNTLDNVSTFYATDVNCELIPLGIPRPVFPAAKRADYGFSDDQFLMVTVGRLVARKAVDQLVTMMHRLDDPRYRLVVIGGGPLLDTLKAQAAELGVAERVHFTGQASDAQKAALLSLSDLFVSTSQHEGFGLVFLEGMSAGLPVVCYDEGGQVDVVREGENGFLVSLNALSEFTARVDAISRDPQLHARLSKACLRDVEHYFIENCAERYASLFERCLRGRSTQG